MSAAFIKYLSHLPEELTASEVNQPDRGPNHIFENFPLHYERNQYEELSPVDKEDIARWLMSFHTLLKNSYYTSDEDHNSLFIVNKKLADSYCADVLISGCMNLLDEEGRLQKAVINKLHLQPLFHKYAHNKAMLEQFANALLFGYAKNIVFRNIADEVFKISEQYHHDETELNDIYDRLEMILEYLDKTLYNHNQITHFFENVVSNYKSIFIERQLANYLQEQSLKTLDEILVADLQKPALGETHFQNLNPEILREREKFWFHVMENLHEDKDLERLNIIWSHLTPESQRAWNQGANHVYLPAKITEAQDYAAEQPWGLNALEKILHVRDNIFLIDYIIRSMDPAKRKEVKEVLQELQAAKFERLLMQKTPEQLFIFLARKSTNPLKMKKLLTQFMPHLERELKTLSTLPKPFYEKPKAKATKHPSKTVKTPRNT